MAQVRENGMKRRGSIAVKSTMAGLLAQSCVMIVNFVVRTLLIRYVTKEVLGIDGVLRDCVSMLALAELGMTSSMLFRLYEPVNRNDTEKINRLMALYRRIYNGLAVCILLIGLAAAPLLPLIIKNTAAGWPFIYMAYALQVAACVATYVMAYKRCLLNAAQRNYVIILIDAAMVLAGGVGKMAVLLLFRSYPAYLLIFALQELAANLLTELYARRHFPEITARGAYEKEERRDLFADTKNLFASKLVGYVYGSTDSIIISAVISTVQVGLLSNYKYIIALIKTFLNSIFAPIRPLVGSALNDDLDMAGRYALLKNYSFVRFVVALLCTVPLTVLSQMFIRIWAGDSFLLPMSVVVLLAVDLYIGCVYGPLGEFIYGMGLFRQDKRVSIEGAVCNLALSLIAVRYFGIAGVLWGTAVSQLLMWIGKIRIVFADCLSDNAGMRRDYLMTQLRYVLLTLGTTAVFLYVQSRVSVLWNYFGFALRGVVIEASLSGCIVLLFRRSEEYRYAIGLIRSRFPRKKRKGNGLS